MGKLEYLDALKRAMTGLTPAVQAKTLAYYEQRFVDGVAAGRSEQAVAAELDDPKKIAMTLRASAHMAAFEQKRNPANFLRMVVAGLGLAIFNLLMIVPAAVYLSMLAALYSAALAFYIIGIAVTASGLAGANELVLNRPFGIVLTDDSDGSERNKQTHISISETGINISSEKRQDSAIDAAARQAEQAARAADADSLANGDSPGPRVGPAQVIKRAEEVAGREIRITTDVDAGSRTTQTAFGLVMVVGSILLFLLSLVVSKYTLIGLKRYLQMNLSLLKGS
ncbi:MAG: hypothetical protein JWP59_1453 [Massilia sp.]|jgi:uncharacterized membrane protein|nr:hypothetical protein [Massilia sp.]